MPGGGAGWGASVCASVVAESTGGMGCVYNEVRRGLFLTMEAKGARSGFNCVRNEDVAAELGDVSRGFVHQLGVDTVEGGRTAEDEKNKNDYFQLAAFHPQRGKGTTRHLHSQHQISCPL